MFIHSLVHLPVKPRQCDSTCRSFAVLDSVLIRDRRATTIAVTTAIHNFFSTMWNKIPNGSHCFHWAHKISMTAWSTMVVTLSVSSESYLSQTVALIGEEHCFSLGAALAWFTHPTAMASNFRSETDSHVVTRLASSAVGLGSEVDSEAPCSVETTAQQAVVLFGGERNFFFPESWAKSRKPIR